MMKLSDFKTLAAANTAPLITRRVFNSNEMTMYLLRCDLLDYVLDFPTGLLRGFAMRVRSDSKFDFRDNTDDGMVNIATLSVLISEANDELLKNKFIHLRDYLVGDANIVTYPYVDVEQDDFDKAKAEALLYGEQRPEHVAYLGAAEWHVKLEHENVRLSVLLDAAVNVDTEIDFALLIRNSEGQTFFPVQNWTVKLIIPAGEVGGAIDVTQTASLTRQVKFTARANIKNSYSVEVTSA